MSKGLGIFVSHACEQSASESLYPFRRMVPLNGLLKTSKAGQKPDREIYFVQIITVFPRFKTVINIDLIEL